MTDDKGNKRQLRKQRREDYLIKKFDVTNGVAVMRMKAALKANSALVSTVKRQLREQTRAVSVVVKRWSDIRIAREKGTCIKDFEGEFNTFVRSIEGPNVLRRGLTTMQREVRALTLTLAFLFGKCYADVERRPPGIGALTTFNDIDRLADDIMAKLDEFGYKYWSDSRDMGAAPARQRTIIHDWLRTIPMDADQGTREHFRRLVAIDANCVGCTNAIRKREQSIVLAEGRISDLFSAINSWRDQIEKDKAANYDDQRHLRMLQNERENVVGEIEGYYANRNK